MVATGRTRDPLRGEVDGLEAAAVAIVAGVGVTAFFALGLLGMIRYAELRRQQRPMLSALFGLMGAVALAAASGMIVYGLVIVA